MTGTGGSTPSPSGGSAGMVATGGSSGAPPVSVGLGCTGNELLCEDFEGTADGAVPTGAWLPLSDSCQYQAAQFSMGVSTEQVNPASGSTKALKIINKHFAECRLSGSFGASDDFWVRAYMYWGTELDLTNRETLAMDLTPGAWVADDSHAVRFGYRSKSPCEEYAGPQVTIIGLSGGESTGCGSRAMPQGEWFCFEAHVNQASAIEVNTYINGEAISYQSTGKPLVSSLITDTPATEKVDHVRLGLFSTSEAQGSVYVDDLAVTTTRVGCGN